MSASNNETSKTTILAKIRSALQAHQLPKPFPEVAAWTPGDDTYIESGLLPEELFAQHFVGLGGKYQYCTSIEDAIAQIQALCSERAWVKIFTNQITWKHLSEQKEISFQMADIQDDTADVCITDCEALIARTGSFLISSKQHLGRVSTVFYPAHIVIATLEDVVYDIADAYTKMQKKYPKQLPSMLSIQTGPSRTADIEKTLVTGVHGPKEVFCFFVDKQLV